jgi:signal transduction histidine kinase
VRRVVAVSAPIVSIGLLVASGVLNAWANKTVSDPLIWLPLTVACATVGSLLVLRRAGGVLGPLFVFVGVQIPLGSAVQAYAYAAIGHGLPGGAWAAWFFQASIGLSLTLFLIVQLFPTGRPLSSRWRILVWLTILVSTTGFMVAALGVVPEFPVNFPGVVHPLQLLPAVITRSFDGFIGMATVVVFAACAVEIVVRYRRSSGEERAQLKWFAAATVIAAIGFAIGILTIPSGPAAVFALLTPLIPVAAGIAILKYHLYDIDVVISKALVIGLLAVFITAVYVAIVVGIGQLVGTTSSPALSIAATVVVAVLFQAVRERVRRLANRLVYGERATPYEVMAGFSARVADAPSTDEVLPQMAEAAGRGVGAVEASVRVHLPGGRDRIERWSSFGAPAERVGEPWTVPIAHQGETIGEVTVLKAANDPLTPAEQELLSDLSAQAGLALHNVRLTEELAIRLAELDVQAAALRVSRERLVTARDAQRRGLQRDIHEGPERQLIDIGRNLSSVERPDQIDSLIKQANDTLEGLRDLARGIFPPLLAEQGVVAALSAHIRKVGANATVEASDAFRARRFDPDTEACIYFCCLQAIQNVIRHAGNAPAVVRLDLDGDAITVEIRDEGRGFDVAATPPGMGLEIVQDRVDALDGTLEVTSAPSHGTTVSIRIPVRALEAVG